MPHKADRRACPFYYRAPRTRLDRRGNPDRILRRLPFRPAHRARRVGRAANTRAYLGHEIVGKVSRVGADVKKFKAGDLAGVGCMVDSCGECESCKADEEQFCDVGGTHLLRIMLQTKKVAATPSVVTRKASLLTRILC